MSEEVNQKFETFVKVDGEYRFVEYDPRNLIAGDTDSAYIDLGEIFDENAKREEVIAFADDIGVRTNETFADFMKSVFNSDPDRSYVIETEREVVSDKSLFCGRKMYAMHVTNSEGLDVDKTKVMGLAIKRTDTPQVVRDFLSELVDALMNLTPFEEVRNMVDEFKERYMTFDMQTIGIPSTVKNLGEYYDKFDQSGSVAGFPYHVRAAMYYNAYCEASDPKIRSGDKIKIIYLDHPETDYIAIPADAAAEELPAFLGVMDVDWKAMWEKVEKKINIILTPIGYDRTSRQKQLVGSILSF